MRIVVIVALCNVKQKKM